MSKPMNKPIKITYNYSEEDKENIYKLVGELIGKKLIREFEKRAS